MLARGAPGQSLAVRAACWAPARASRAAGGGRGARVGDRVRRGAPRRGAGGPLPAQVLPLVRGAPGLTRREREPLVTAPTTAARPDRARRRASGAAPGSPPERIDGCYTARAPSGRQLQLFHGAERQSSHQKALKSSRPRSITSRPIAGARSPSASRRLASSATSPRTPSTTTPRTSRRCSRSRSPTSRRSCATPA